MEKVRLNNGVEMPILGFGVYQINDAVQCERAVSVALETGYRSIDTAAAYHNEQAVGAAIAQSGIPRGQLFITTKLWISDAGEEKAFKEFEKSMKNLGLDYLDLYLIHQPYGDIYGSWRAMEKLYKQGLIRAIGVSNFQPDRLMDLLIHNDITPAVNQIETHPYHQQVETQQFLIDQGVQIESWGPFAEGRNNLFKNKLLQSIGDRYGKSIAQVVLRWLVQRKVVAIPKSVTESRIRKNFDIFDFELSPEDVESISTLDLKRSAFFDHRDPKIVTLLSNIH
ncbi:MAG: aldo/keto reductase [Rikenellaceae bacterium]|nr:aldo/keto reductase [Rikenellaceae bacterium]